MPRRLYWTLPEFLPRRYRPRSLSTTAQVQFGWDIPATDGFDPAQPECDIRSSQKSRHSTRFSRYASTVEPDVVQRQE